MAVRPSAHGHPAITAIAGAASAASNAADRNAGLLEREQEIAPLGGRVAHQERGRRGRDKPVPQADHDRSRATSRNFDGSAMSSIPHASPVSPIW